MTNDSNHDNKDQARTRPEPSDAGGGAEQAMTPPEHKPATRAPGELWSFVRKLLSQGGDIWLDHQNKGYEQYSARLDVAARERAEELMSLLASLPDPQPAQPQQQDDARTRSAGAGTALAAGVSAGTSWKPISTAPRDGEFVAAALVTPDVSGAPYWEFHVGYINDETGEFEPYQGWDLGDYLFWTEVPPGSKDA